MAYIFVDWVHLRQYRLPWEPEFPIVSDKVIVGIDPDSGHVVDRPQYRKKKHSGSFETTALVRSTGSYYEIDFNPSRFNRPENAFGYQWPDALAIANHIVTALGLPEFRLTDETVVTSREWNEAKKQFDVTRQPAGAVLLRLDVTSHYRCGDRGKLDAYIRYLRRQTLPRRKTKPQGRSTVVFYSKSSSISVYDKAQEMRDHSPKPGPAFEARKPVIARAESEGIARVELRAWRAKLIREGLRSAASVTQAKLETLFEKETENMTEEIREDDVQKLTHGELGSLLAWKNGFDVRTLVSRNTFYAHRRRIKEVTNFDIGAENPTRLDPKTEGFVIDKNVDLPSDYDLPPVKKAAHG